MGVFVDYLVLIVAVLLHALCAGYLGGCPICVASFPCGTGVKHMAMLVQLGAHIWRMQANRLHDRFMRRALPAACSDARPALFAVG